MISTKVIIPLDKIYAIEQKLCHFGTLNAYFIILPHLSVPLQICQLYATYATSTRELFFVFGVGHVPNI